MLLRRIKHHVVSENWFAVFVDFVIVVVGVYVGIEVSNWNEARQEEDHAREYLERVRADLVHDSVTISNRHRFWTQVIEYGEAAILFSEVGDLYDNSEAKTVLAYYQASQVAPYTSVKTTYEELKAAGDLRLIENAELRAQLAEYYVNSTGLQAEHLLQFLPAYREHIRGMVPYDIQQFIWANCHGAVENAQVLKDCDLPISDTEALALLAEILGDPQTIRGLRFWISNLSVARAVLDGNLTGVSEMLKLVDAALATN